MEQNGKMLFNSLIGNKETKKILSNINNPTHAYMFVGPEGIGKNLFAKEFANKFLCISDNNKPCYNCKSCIQFKDGNNMDFKTIDIIENKIKIEQIREIISQINEIPLLAPKKIYVINNADKMTVQAQNCLLKILEEPPKYVIIILIVANEQAMLSTIKSRCVKVKFEKISNEELEEFLSKNGYNTSEEALNLYSGSIGKALKIQDKIDQYIKLKVFINQKSKMEFLKMAKTIYEDKEEIYEYIEYLNVIFMELCKKNIKYTKCIDALNDIIPKLNYNANLEMLLDETFLELYNIINEERKI